MKAGAKAAQIEAAFEEAEAQVRRYASDRALLPLLLGDRELRAGMLVFVGVKKVLYRAWVGAAKATEQPRAKGRRS